MFVHTLTAHPVMHESRVFSQTGSQPHKDSCPLTWMRLHQTNGDEIYSYAPLVREGHFLDLGGPFAIAGSAEQSKSAQESGVWLTVPTVLSNVFTEKIERNI